MINSNWQVSIDLGPLFILDRNLIMHNFFLKMKPIQTDQISGHVKARLWLF